MPLDIIIGAQWGDEGKGRITDQLAKNVQVVARYSGGDNAGHTVTVGSEIFKLHLLPSGIIQPHIIGVLGNGMVINPQRLLEEMQMLRSKGVNISPERVKLSYAAHLITPGHIAVDQATEVSRGAGKIGTTGRGIGPAYTDKTARRGLRLEIFREPETAADVIAQHTSLTNLTLQNLYGQPPLEPQAIAAQFANYAQQLKPYLADTSLYLHQALTENKNVLAEGAQGSLLDIDHGTYPYVTSSSPTTGGVFTGLGLAPQFTRRVIGVTKAFQTRVGEGPFPSEVFGADAERLRGTGANPWDEFGTTTGRPRRCGWLDLVLLRYAIRINGLTELALTKMDILSGLAKIKLCVAYRYEGKIYEEAPLGPAHLEGCEAVYEEMAGWADEVKDVRIFTALPHAAQNYVQRLETLLALPIKIISVGAEREQLIIKD